MKHLIGKAVLILDRNRGIYFGYLVQELEDGDAVELKNFRHCFSFQAGASPNKGTYCLATIGPLKGSKVGPKVDGKIRQVSKIVVVTKEAEKKWNEIGWE